MTEQLMAQAGLGGLMREVVEWCRQYAVVHHNSLLCDTLLAKGNEWWSNGNCRAENKEACMNEGWFKNLEGLIGVRRSKDTSRQEK